MGYSCHVHVLRAAVLTLGVCTCVVDGAKILLLPVMFKSLLLEKVIVGDELAARGHDVYTLLDAAYADLGLLRGTRVKSILYTEPPGADTVISMMEDIGRHLFDDPPAAGDVTEDATVHLCNAVCARQLRNRKLMKTLGAHQFDLAVVDANDYHMCSYILPHNLSVPHVYMFSYAPELGIGVPALPSFVGTVYSRFTTPSSYWDMLDTVQVLRAFDHHYRLGGDPALMAEFAPGVASIWDIVRRSELFLITRDHVLEAARPSLPNVIYLPGITTRPASPLPKPLASLLGDSTTVCLVSFGSTVEDMPPGLLGRLLDGLGAVEHVTFLLRISGRSLEPVRARVPPNVHPQGWLPQNDILAHPNIRLFITHCGNNGQYEAVYHGVPMIGFPIFIDQEHNCMRAETKGLGVTLSLFSFTAAELSERIVQVLDTPEYTARAARYSAILQSMPLARETAADWIEHVIRFGGQHLRSPSQDMPLYEMLMLDVIAAVFLVVLVSLFCGCWLVSWVWRRGARKPKTD